MPSTYLRTDELEAIRDRVAEEAMHQGRVFRREDLPEWGINPGVLRTMVSRRFWMRMRFGVYTDTAVWDSSQAIPREALVLDCAAILKSLPLPAFAFGNTAALLHGLPLPSEQVREIELVRDIGRDLRALQPRKTNSRQRTGVRIKTHDLNRDHTTRVSGIPVVSRELAAFSAAASCELEWAVSILDAASWGLAEVPDEFSQFVSDWPLLKGIGIIRKALPLVRTGAQTPLETLSRIRLLAAGIPEPLLQHPFHDRMGLIGFTDMFWPELRVIGEADGLIKYTGPEVTIREKLREDRLRALGFIVVRWTWDEILNDPAAVADRIKRAARIAFGSAA